MTYSIGANCTAIPSISRTTRCRRAHLQLVRPGEVPVGPHGRVVVDQVEMTVLRTGPLQGDDLGGRAVELVRRPQCREGVGIPGCQPDDQVDVER